MNTLLLMAAILPIALGGLLRWLPAPAARRLMQAALLPLVLLAIGVWIYPVRQPLVPHWRLISMLVALFSAALAYRWLRRPTAWPFIEPSLILLLGFIVLLLLRVSSTACMVLLANLPALLFHALPRAKTLDTRKQSIGHLRRWWSRIFGPAAPAGLLAAGSVVAAIFAPQMPSDQSTPVGSGAVGLVAAFLIWQLLLHLVPGEIVMARPKAQPTTQASDLIWSLQRPVRMASVVAILLTLLQLRLRIDQSPFAQHVLVILTAAMLIVVGSLLLMERSVPTLLSLMEYVWVGGFLAGMCVLHALGTDMLRQYVAWVLGFMAINCWLLPRLMASSGLRVNLDTIAGWRFTRMGNAIWLSLVVVAMQFLPIMPADHYLVALLAGLTAHHPIIAILVLMANGAMLVAAFRLWGAMYLPGNRADCK